MPYMLETTADASCIFIFVSLVGLKLLFSAISFNFNPLNDSWISTRISYDYRSAFYPYIILFCIRPFLSKKLHTHYVHLIKVVNAYLYHAVVVCWFPTLLL